MAEPLSFVEFEANFPDDLIFDEDDVLVQPGGRNILNAIVPMLAAQGLNVSDVYQHSDYGWAVDVDAGNESFWFLIQYPEPWLLLSQDKTGFFKRLRRKDPALGRIMLALKDSLEKDARFREVRCFTKSEYENPVPHVADEASEE